jgi:Fic family protein
MPLRPLHYLSPRRFETVPILKKLGSASRQLAELKGVAGTIPNQNMLVNTLGLQEAKESSAIENIVTTHDDLFREAINPTASPDAVAKEVLRYREALQAGFIQVTQSGLLTTNHILEVQAALEKNEAGFRKVPGTSLKNQMGETIYTPPQDFNEITALMSDLERFINEEHLFEADPLVKMALVHHHFESIHPFYDGNGRTGRIVNILYLVKNGLLDIPVLYLSRYILRTKAEYYRLLQSVRTDDAWEDWILYILTGVEETAAQGIATIQKIKEALLVAKHRIRADYKFYSQDLINNLFNHPYTRIEFVKKDLNVSRLTATRYLEALTAGGFLEKKKVGQSNYFINHRLVSILTGD